MKIITKSILMKSQQSKSAIRKKMLNRLQKQKEVVRLKKSFYIKEKLFGLVEFIKAKTILFYLSFDGEVETWRMIEQAISLGKMAALPFICRQTFGMAPSVITDCSLSVAPGPYGIYQPRHRRTLPAAMIDLIVVPAVAFDHKGNRIGRGKGYYDCFLRSLAKPIPTVGLAFDFQVYTRLSCMTPLDVAVERVLYA